MEDLTGRTLLNNYYLEYRKGSGKIAEVYKAWDARKSVPVAVKVLRTGHKGDQDFYQYFSHEADLMAHLEHPNIVRFYDFFSEGSIVFIVMDWVDGPNLKEIIQKEHAPLAMDMVLQVLKPVTAALQYAHSQKIIHCDVKPANILINQNSKVLLTDFGIARHASQRTTGGTPPYMAPEQFNGNRLTAQTDIYGLGVTLYEMLSGGQVPYRGDTGQTSSTTIRERIHWEVMNLPYPDLSRYNQTVPPGVENAVKKALNKNPAQRFQSAIDLYNAVEQAAGNTVDVQEGIFQKFLPEVKLPAIHPVEPVVDKPEITQRSSPRAYAKLPPNFHGAFLLVLQGEWKGLFLPIYKTVYTVGRAGQNHLPLHERSISRNHAQIQLTQRGLYIRDVGSKLGTFVNGQLIRGAYRLESGDVIQIGYEQVFEVHLQ